MSGMAAILYLDSDNNERENTAHNERQSILGTGHTAVKVANAWDHEPHKGHAHQDEGNIARVEL